jgi:hypothetical protein
MVYRQYFREVFMKKEEANLSGSGVIPAGGIRCSLTETQINALISVLKERFQKNSDRHPDIAWSGVEDRLQENPGKMKSLALMESTGGEPDVFAKDQQTGEILFADFSKESPAGRRSLCYDPRSPGGKKSEPAGQQRP